LTGDDLAAEMRCAAAALTADDRAALSESGVGPDELFWMCGAARALVKGGLYRPDPQGARVVITPVRGDDLLTPESAYPLATLRFAPIVDLVAWHPAEPESWARRCGAADWLGCIEPQCLDPDPVPVHASVLHWLQSGCIGLVPLSDDPADFYRLMSACRRIRAEDDAHAKAMRKAMRRCWPMPTVSVGEEENVDPG
jgi:hypothetical protein